jgi:hypothetical protein
MESSWPRATRAKPVPHQQGALLPLLCFRIATYATATTSCPWAALKSRRRVDQRPAVVVEGRPQSGSTWSHCLRHLRHRATR